MVIDDFEFGEIILRRNALAKSVSFGVDNTGRLKLVYPTAMSDKMIKKILEQNRSMIRGSLRNFNPETQKARDQKIKLLRKEAEVFLPYRIAYLAKLHGFKYKKLRLSYPTTRWGSCSSTGTISLSIAIMKLPDNLRDHVIMHELTHLKHMNHSLQFWMALEKIDPRCKYHREMLKHYNPQIWKD